MMSPCRSRKRLRRVRCIMLVAVAVALCACGQVNQTEEDHYRRAMELQAGGDLRAAVIEFKNVLQQNPGNADARARLGALNLELGNPTAAIQELERALDLGAESAVALAPLARARLLLGDNEAVLEALDGADDASGAFDALRGEALLGLGRLDEARVAFSSALDRRPDDAAAIVGLARIDLLRGEEDDARARLDQALAADPASVAAWDLKGDVEFGAGAAAEADAAYGEAIRHSRAPYRHHLKRAMARLAQRDFSAAEEDAAALRRIAANHAATAYIDGLLAFFQRRPVEAQVALEQSLKRGPEFLPALYYLGAAHFMQRNWRQAEHYLARFVDAAPGSAEATRLLAAARLQGGDAERAEPLLASLLERRPDDLMALNLMGNLHLSRGRREEGLDHLRRAAAARPDDPRQQAALAVALLQGGDESGEGMRLLERVIEQAPEEAAGLEITRVLQLLRERRFDEALEAAQALARERTDDPVPRNLEAAARSGLGDEAGARAALAEALRLDPGNPLATTGLAMHARADGDIERARGLYEESLRHHQGTLVILMQLAELEFSEGETAAMRRHLEEAIERHPDSAAPRLVLGRYLLGEGDARGALKLVEPLSGTPAGNDPQVLELLARAQIADGQPQLATGTLRSMSERIPNNAEARFRLAQGFLQVEQLNDAARELRRALQLEPGHAGALEGLARVEAHGKRYDEALELLRRLQRVAPDHANGHILEGEVLAARGEHEAALQAFLKGWEIAPATALAVRIGTAYRRAGQPAQARRFLEARLEQHPGEAPVRFALADLRLASGDHEGATSDYERLLRDGEENPILLNNLAFLYQGRDDARALELAERAHALQPDDPAVADTLGWILVRQGEVARGLEHLARARDGLPEHASVRYHYAYALARNDRRAEARREVAALLDETRDFPEMADAEALLESLR